MISHPRQTIFVHVPKTGGQSIEAVFARDLGLGAAGRERLLLRRNLDPALGPRRLAHLFADEYVGCGHVDALTFARYTTFAVVRHPHDRMISEYRYRVAGLRGRHADPPPDFGDFLARPAEDAFLDTARHMVPQARYVADRSGRQLVDHVLRFETLAAEFAPLARRIFGAPRTLPHVNATAGTFAFTRADLTEAHRRRVRDRYAEDFEMFGYDG